MTPMPGFTGDPALDLICELDADWLRGVDDDTRARYYDEMRRTVLYRQVAFGLVVQAFVAFVVDTLKADLAHLGRRVRSLIERPS